MAFIIRDELGIQDFDEKNLKCRCPFHEEDHASFIWNHKGLSFRCFGACGRSYDIIDVYMTKGMTYLEACEKLFEVAEIPYTFGEKGIKTKRSYKYPKEVVCTDKTQVYEYLEKRKISKKTCDYLDIRQDEHGNCVFNYYNDNDVLMMVKYRPSRKVNHGEPKNWCQKGADTSPILFNMNRINPEQPLLICSGELDCAAAIEIGYKNAVSIPLGDANVQWLDENSDWLDNFSEIIICPDNDKSGANFADKVTPALGKYRTKVVKIPETIEVNEKQKYIKDLNELLFWGGKEKALEVILDAKETPIESVIDFTEIESINYEDIGGVEFGLKPLDDEFMRLFYGTLTIVSGRPGSGKSSLLTQLICNTIDRGINAWLFSGEFKNQIGRSWFDYILAGPRNLVDCVSLKGNEYKKPSGEALSSINKAYKGMFSVYRDSCSNSIDDLLASMKDVVKRYAARLLVLDNFMCIDTETTQNELNTQTQVIKRLISFATNYDCAVVLVCHPRKSDESNDVGINDIAGTSNIINLAHRSFSLRRVTEDEREKVNDMRFSEKKRKLYSYDVIVHIIKDRMFGRANIDLGLWYDPDTRRFYTNDNEYDYHYKWDKKRYSDVLMSPATVASQTPFDVQQEIKEEIYEDDDGEDFYGIF